MFRFILIFLFPLLISLFQGSGRQEIKGVADSSSKVLLAEHKKAMVTISIPDTPSETQQFAGSELAKYLEEISGTNFYVRSESGNPGSAILIRYNKELAQESYSIAIHHSNIIISGGSDRAILYAIYDFLHRLGCLWLAPDFSFYKGLSEYIPHKTKLYYEAAQPVSEHPQFTYRKLDVEEGHSHNVKNLKKMIEWMPKLRYNTLMIPLDYGGAGRVQWDKWRNQLTPELEKRDLMIEVGGHGYQNFLNAGMEDSTLFRQHPDWFGKNKDCQPSIAKHLVFNTSNKDAVNYFTDRILNYLKKHPEIDIFDFWPPDGAHWSDCSTFVKLGTSQDRQARLANKVDSAIHAAHLGVRLEIIAYARALQPPQQVHLNDDILVDFCPIDQSFEKQIYDDTSARNLAYKYAMLAWRNNYRGDIGIYSYYRKYAWRSLPNIMPHFIQHDLLWYAQVPMQGISTYAEPGDWYTYELNHYILGNLAWNPHKDIDALIQKFCFSRYGAYGKTVMKIYDLLEQTVRIKGSIPFTSLKSATSLEKASEAINQKIEILKDLKKTSDSEAISMNIERLILILQYVHKDLQIQHARASEVPKEAIIAKIENLVQFLDKNCAKGLFLSYKDNKILRYLRHYEF